MKQQSSWLVFLIISIIFIGLIGIFLIIFRPFPRVESKNLDEAILMGLKYYDPDTYINPYMDGIEFISFKVLYTNFVPNKEIERKYMELLDNPEITKKYQGYLIYFFNLTLNDTPVFKPILQSEFLSTGYDSIDEITIRSMFCRDYPLPDGFFDKIEEIGSHGGYDLTHIYGAVQILEERGCEPEKTEKVKEDLVKKVYEEQLQDGNNIKDFSLYAERVFILISSGHYELVKKSWIDAIIRAQNPDGGWPSHKLGEPSFTHSTYYGLLVLLSYNKYIVQGKPLDYSVFRPLNIKIARISQDVEDELRAKGSAETIIKVSSDKDKQELLSKFGGEELSDDLVKVKITENDAKQLSYFSSVDYVYPDYQTKVLGDYLSQIKYQEALNEFNLTGKGIKICILDTGVNKSVVPYSVGYDFVNNDNDPS
ncbi:MAG: hypothetical protein J7L43_00370, partial [Candidatus Aenigmarchaeota archaeon]|nr:hypothetical protein [Candidatus Aenigmarchaeota archaeon]